ncbi:MAG: SMC-Scp complex subunit ScpB [Pikeienuella sp.]
MTASPEEPDDGADPAHSDRRPRPGPLFGVSPETEAERLIEALLFASASPVTASEIARRLPQGTDLDAALLRLGERYAGRGIVLERAGDAWSFRTAPDLAPLLAREAVETRKLSRAAMETLAIIAYHQPVTRAEIEAIRGVAVSRGTLDLLLDLGWVGLGARRETPGRPGTFITTPDFLDAFALASAADLPGLAELKATGLLGPGPAEALPNFGDPEAREAE